RKQLSTFATVLKITIEIFIEGIERSKQLFQTHILGLYLDKSNLIFLFIITSLLSVCSFVDGVHITLDHTKNLHILCMVTPFVRWIRY
ncbi:unnamed protein product, partial [Callosobruchus maculatus]